MRKFTKELSGVPGITAVLPSVNEHAMPGYVAIYTGGVWGVYICVYRWEEKGTTEDEMVGWHH